MSDVVRVTQADDDPFAWAQPAPEPKGRDDYTDRHGLDSLDALGACLVALDPLVSQTDTTLADAVRYLSDHLDVDGLVQTADKIAQLRERLTYALAYVERAAGQTVADYPAGREGELPDGRVYEIRRGSERKAWDHQRWQKDAREKLLAKHGIGSGVAVVPETGEEISVHEVLAEIEAVHGSTGPRVTALRPLGLDPDDYCERSPGPYRVIISAKPDPGLDTSA